MFQFVPSKLSLTPFLTILQKAKKKFERRILTFLNSSKACVYSFYIFEHLISAVVWDIEKFTLPKTNAALEKCFLTDWMSGGSCILRACLDGTLSYNYANKTQSKLRLKYIPSHLNSSYFSQHSQDLNSVDKTSLVSRAMYSYPTHCKTALTIKICALITSARSNVCFGRENSGYGNLNNNK